MSHCMKLFLPLFLALWILLAGCAEKPTPTPATSPSASTADETPGLQGAFVPQDDRILLIVGQEIDSLREYTASGCCPVPGGVTTYIGLYKVLDESLQFGGMGIDAEGRPLELHRPAPPAGLSPCRI